MRAGSHCQGKEAFLERPLRYCRFNKIKKHINKNSNVLDLGCGYNGDFLKYIETDLGAGTGVDISVNASNSPKIRLVRGNLEDQLCFAENVFDVVVSLANLEHLSNPEKMLKEIKRVLKPGGILLLTTPSKRAKPVLEFLSFGLGIISKQEIADHKHYFDEKSLRKYINDAGFSYCQHKYFQLFMNNFVIAHK
ncbi:MAG: methyltransferase domain-containing protein [bacterium]|nr:methyltransferase domain-containing protein [bacterium]